MDFSRYKPSERFAKLAQKELAREMWRCLTASENISRMKKAIARGEAPVTAIEKQLHEKFSSQIETAKESSDELRILCMNMMKQLLEYKGYRHTACTLLFDGCFVKSAGLFELSE